MCHSGVSNAAFLLIQFPLLGIWVGSLLCPVSHGTLTSGILCSFLLGIFSDFFSPFFLVSHHCFEWDFILSMNHCFFHPDLRRQKPVQLLVMVISLVVFLLDTVSQRKARAYFCEWILPAVLQKRVYWVLAFVWQYRDVCFVCQRVCFYSWFPRFWLAFDLQVWVIRI